MTTLQTPRGTKFRTETNRRFVLVREGEGFGIADLDRPIVLQRSDSLATLRTAVRRQGMHDVARYGHTVEYVFIIDRVTGEALPLVHGQPPTVRNATRVRTVAQLRLGDVVRRDLSEAWQRVNAIAPDRRGVTLSRDGALRVTPDLTYETLARD